MSETKRERNRWMSPAEVQLEKLRRQAKEDKAWSAKCGPVTVRKIKQDD